MARLVLIGHVHAGLSQYRTIIRSRTRGSLEMTSKVSFHAWIGSRKRGMIFIVQIILEIIHVDVRSNDYGSVLSQWLVLRNTHNDR